LVNSWLEARRNQAGDFQLFHVMRKRWHSDLEAPAHAHIKAASFSLYFGFAV
jgi:hypothetical protein